MNSRKRCFLIKHIKILKHLRCRNAYGDGLTIQLLGRRRTLPLQPLRTSHCTYDHQNKKIRGSHHHRQESKIVPKNQ